MPTSETDLPEVAEVEEEGIVDLDELEEVTPYPYTITAYGADFPVDGLVQRMESGDIVIPTFDPSVNLDSDIEGFQRRFVWTRAQMDRFVESLLLGLPVPGIFLVKEEPSNIFLVLDGQQRLRTLAAFYRGQTGGSTYRLRYVGDQFRGRSYGTLEPEDRRRLDNAIIHATIVRQDQPSNDQSSIYLIFERLNTGGTQLQPQEIRVALYSGPFINLLRELNGNTAWRALLGVKSARLKDQELILRFFAMLHRSDKYRRPMKDFLNRFAGDNRTLEVISEDALRDTFDQVTAVVAESIGVDAFRPQGPVNAAAAESVMFGVAKRLEDGALKDAPKLREHYDRLMADPEYRMAIEGSTAAEENVYIRLTRAEAAFADVP